jgi:hypothetical protein
VRHAWPSGSQIIFWGGVRILFMSQDFKIFNSTHKFFWFVNGRCTVLISVGKTTVLTDVFVLSLSFNKFKDMVLRAQNSCLTVPQLISHGATTHILRCHNSYLTVTQLISRCHSLHLTVPQLISYGATTHISRAHNSYHILNDSLDTHPVICHCVSTGSVGLPLALFRKLQTNKRTNKLTEHLYGARKLTNFGKFFGKSSSVWH